MNDISLKAYGKINLGLDVLRKREDGYHDLDMIMQTVGVYDDIVITKTDKDIVVTTDADILPNDRGNLAFMAAKILMERCNINSGIKIHINKRIPIAGGMAGGSSDCAATLRGVNELFELCLDDMELRKIGVTLGADVPYCVMGKTARAEGIGDILTPLPSPPQCHIIIAKPDIYVSTGFVYGRIRPDKIEKHPDIQGIIDGLKSENLRKIAASLGNVMEDVTIPEHPIIREIKDEMLEGGAMNALMSGSGPTVFGLFDSREKAEYVMERLTDKTSQLYLTNFI